MAVDYDGKGGWREALHRAHPDWVDYQPEGWELGRRRGAQGRLSIVTPTMNCIDNPVEPWEGTKPGRQYQS